ncbi:MAG TPA: ATP-dependent DNA helicase [Streptosporangiaceae bacterium]|nr:ATP-dependent DNA helicase [Streptosporangiaceae bacterium]
MDHHPDAYRLLRRPGPPAGPPRLDEAQQAVVSHAGGPLLVLAGPGTGKTTAIVEAVVERITQRRIDPERVLVLTFSRKAAQELRERITTRLRRTTRQPLALTFHSYAYTLVRREFVLVGDSPPTLLSGPEQLLEVRRMLRGEATGAAQRWPERLRPALSTRGFATELRDFLLRAAERGLDGRGLARLGRAHGRDDWVAAGGFLDRYTARFDLAPVPAYDYAEIVRIAAALLSRSATRDRERKAYDVVLVDEYQDTDPAQEALLHALAGDGRELIAVGDPDQSIYAFRGADTRAMTRFPDLFRTPDERPASVIALRTCRRSGPVLLAASRRVAYRLPSAAGLSGAGLFGGSPAGGSPAGGSPAGGPPGSEHRAPGRPGSEQPSGARRGRGHRDLVPLPAATPGTVRVLIASSASQEAAVIADTLRRAHLVDGIAWSSMAVLVRSAVRQVPLLRRALATAGVPAVVAGDELPLAEEPGARPLLALLRCALQPGALDEDAAAELLTGPLGGTDALGLRRLRRALHGADAAAGQRPAEQPLASALRDPRQLALLAGPAVAAARRVASLLALARRTAQGTTGDDAALPPGGGAASVPPGRADAGELAGRADAAVLAGRGDAAAGPGNGGHPGTAYDVLWAVWAASGLGPAWQAASAAGGSRGEAADRDLDAVVALFDAADRFAARLPPGSPWLFLDSMGGQEIPGDTLADRAPEGEAVRILTAHRSKGLEWDLVVVAGVQEGTWPDLRMRSSLLGMDELVDAVAGRDAAGAAGGSDAASAALVSKLLDEERRLFYVAVTRPRRALVVTAVGGDDSEDRPSRFLAELAGDDVEIEHVAAADRHWLSLPALTAELRRAAADGGRPMAVRQAAAAQLARLAATGVRGAHPRQWYALTTLSDPGLLTEGIVQLSPSQVESFTKCGLRWLLEAAAGAGSSDVLRHLGTVIHAAAVLAAEGADEDGIDERIDEIWHHLDFGSAWYSEKQRQLARRMVARFLAWHRGNPRALVAVEQTLRVRIGQVEITGRVDRLERDGHGGGVIVDLKTGSGRPADSDLDRNPQLGVYQLAVLLGAFERFGLIDPGGAELVQVGRAGLKAEVKVQRQRALADDPEPGWAASLVETVAAGMAGPVFGATVNPGCRVCPVRSCCPVHPDGAQVTP